MNAFKKLLLVALLCLPLPALPQNTNNMAAQILASAARTAVTVNSGDQTNCCYPSVAVIMNVSAYTTGNYTPVVQGKDPVSSTYYDILVGPAISSTGITIIKVGPGIVPLTNASAADWLPRVWRVQIRGAASPSMTFSIGAFLGAQ